MRGRRGKSEKMPHNKKKPFPRVMRFEGRELVGGAAEGTLLYTDVGLSFWGGVDEVTSTVIDVHHPLHGQRVEGRVLAIPNGRGSCTGSQVVLELVLNGCAPAAIVMAQPDHIVALGVVIADELFGRSIPVVSLGEEGFAALGRHAAADSKSPRVEVVGRTVRFVEEDAENEAGAMGTAARFHSARDLLAAACDGVEMCAEDAAMLRGERGDAPRVAMRIVLRAAAMQDARRLLTIEQVHIDGCTYIGPGGLRFAESLVEMGGRVAVPTTLNSISVDRQRWVALGVDSALGEPASALAEAYVALGATPSFTCAPYLLDSRPALGDQIAWGESNAVVFANSVLGARTQKYADYLDVCAAITGRAPEMGCHIDGNRAATLVLDVAPLLEALVAAAPADGTPPFDDSFWPALGYLVGLSAGAALPVISGLNRLHGSPLAPSTDDLKAFSAACVCARCALPLSTRALRVFHRSHSPAPFVPPSRHRFGTTASSAMFHIVGHTPEAPTLAAALQRDAAATPPGAERTPTRALTHDAFVDAWRALDSGRSTSDDARDDARDDACDAVQLVAVGNPHLSLAECAALALLCDAAVARGERVARGVSFVVTSGRAIFAEASAAGHIDSLAAYGITFVNDTCWCMLTEPVVPAASTALITNSAKYAHYAPGLVRKRVRFASLAGCVEAARTGRAPVEPAWLHRSGARALSTAAARALRRAVLRR